MSCLALFNMHVLFTNGGIKCTNNVLFDVCSSDDSCSLLPSSIFVLVRKVCSKLPELSAGPDVVTMYSCCT